MRILDEISNISLEKILLYLTYSEAIELRDSLENLLEKPTNNHVHVPSEDYQKEITVCIYDVKHLEDFNERSKNIILHDK